MEGLLTDEAELVGPLEAEVGVLADDLSLLVLGDDLVDTADQAEEGTRSGRGCVRLSAGRKEPPTRGIIGDGGEDARRWSSPGIGLEEER